MLRLEAAEAGCCALLRLSGDLRLRDAPDLAAGLRKAFASGATGVVCDLSGLRSLDRRCASMFVVVGGERPWPGPALFLAGASGSVRAVLHALGVHRFLRLTDSVPAAVAAAEVRPPRLREVFLGQGDRHDARRARRFGADVCTRWDLPELAPTVELIISELVTNVVRHARAPFELRLEAHPGWVRVAVRDWGPGLSAWPAPPTDPLIEGGQGLPIVAGLADVHGLARHPGGGNVVWAGIRADTAPHPTGPDAAVRAERTINESPSGQWHQSLALSWQRTHPKVVEIAVSAEPPHPAIAAGRWLVPRDVLATGARRLIAISSVVLVPDPELAIVRLRLDPGVTCDLPIGWLHSFLTQLID